MVRVRYFAGAKAAAGVERDDVPATNLQALVSTLADRRGPALAQVLGACSFLLDGVTIHERTTVLPEESTVDILPPFSGG